MSIPCQFHPCKNDILPTMETLKYTLDLAQKTGKLILEFYNRAGIQGNLKTDRTVVTAADLAADRLLRESLQRDFPQDGILSEEENTIFPRDKEYVWIIDPLDGTTNFSLGLHYWGISIARIKNGYPDLGVLYFPMLDELFSASRGGGAELNGSQLKVNPDMEALPATFFSHCSRTQRNYDVKIRYKPRILGSAAYGLVTVARGSAILAMEVTPKIWDLSASWVITKEAGGTIASLNGKSPFPLHPGTDYEKVSYPLLVAPTPEIWETGRQNILKKRD
jgi:myo-inositol-1(or 4)-monophosphatase